MPRRLLLALILIAAVATAAFVWLRPRPRPGNDMNALAERYVRLVLALGQHDRNYVDAYYGPPEWRTEAEHAKVPLSEIDAASADLAGDLEALAPPTTADELTRLRYEYLTGQLASLRARVAMLGGTRLPFDEESKALFGAVSPPHQEEEFLAVIGELDKRLPGSGPLLDRYEAFRSRFIIPPDRFDATFRAAIDGCRSRTLKHIRLPDKESFTVEYVTDKSWGAYNWYKGGYHSVIQVNTDLPKHPHDALELACHEGYPGHHVYNALLEKNFVRDRRWPEFSVYALFSPQSLIAEGTADFGVTVAFPGPERLAFAQSVIFPAAGLDPSTAAAYYEVVDLAAKLDYAGDEAARRYLDGEMDVEAAAAFLEKFGLHSRPRASQRIRFFDDYRTYTINYTIGEDLVARWVESRGGTVSNPERRWAAFEDLISSPRLPAALSQ